MEKVTGSSTGERLNATILTAFAAEDKVNGGYFHVEKNLAQDGESVAILLLVYAAVVFIIST